MSGKETFGDVTCIAESDKAILVDIEGEEFWIPKSEVDDDSEVWSDGDEGDLIISTFIARKRGLI